MVDPFQKQSSTVITTYSLKQIMSKWCSKKYSLAIFVRQSRQNKIRQKETSCDGRTY